MATDCLSNLVLYSSNMSSGAFVAALCRSVCRSVRSHSTFLAFLSCLKVEKFRYEYFMDVNAPAQLISAPATSFLPLPNSILPLPNRPRQCCRVYGLVLNTLIHYFPSYSFMCRSVEMYFYVVNTYCIYIC